MTPAGPLLGLFLVSSSFLGSIVTCDNVFIRLRRRLVPSDGT